MDDNSTITIISVLIGGILSLFGSYVAVSYGAKKSLEKEYLLKSLEIMEKLELRENIYDLLWDKTSELKKIEDLNLKYIQSLCNIIEKIIENKKLVLYCPIDHEINELYNNLLNLDIKNKKQKQKLYKNITYVNNRIKMIMAYVTYNPNKSNFLKRVKIWLMKNI